MADEAQAVGLLGRGVMYVDRWRIAGIATCGDGDGAADGLGGVA